MVELPQQYKMLLLFFRKDVKIIFPEKQRKRQFFNFNSRYLSVHPFKLNSIPFLTQNLLSEYFILTSSFPIPFTAPLAHTHAYTHTTFIVVFYLHIFYIPIFLLFSNGFFKIMKFLTHTLEKCTPDIFYQKKIRKTRKIQ